MSEASVREFVLNATATEITNRIEQQAKELAEAQARVVELMGFVRLVSAHFVDPSMFSVELLQGEKFKEFLANAEKVDKEIRERCRELLAATDTAAIVQKWREQHYEECAVICDQFKHEQEVCSKQSVRTERGKQLAQDSASAAYICAETIRRAAIRAAAKAK